MAYSKIPETILCFRCMLGNMRQNADRTRLAADVPLGSVLHGAVGRAYGMPVSEALAVVVIFIGMGLWRNPDLLTRFGTRPLIWMLPFLTSRLVPCLYNTLYSACSRRGFVSS